jgi:hypothetical protein
MAQVNPLLMAICTSLSNISLVLYCKILFGSANHWEFRNFAIHVMSRNSQAVTVSVEFPLNLAPTVEVNAIHRQTFSLKSQRFAESNRL